MAGAGKTPQGTTSGAFASPILGVLAVAFCVVAFGSGGMNGGLFGDSLRGAGSADKQEPTQAVAELEDKARADNMFDIDYANGGNTIYYDFAARTSHWTSTWRPATTSRKTLPRTTRATP